MKLKNIFESTNGDFKSLRNMLVTGFQDMGIKVKEISNEMVKDFETELDKIMPQSKAEHAHEQDIMNVQTRAATRVAKKHNLK